LGLSERLKKKVGAIGKTGHASIFAASDLRGKKKVHRSEKPTGRRGDLRTGASPAKKMKNGEEEERKRRSPGNRPLLPNLPRGGRPRCE